MRFLLLPVAACLMAFSLSSPAEARRGGSAAQELLFVAPTKLSDPSGNPLALCHLVKTHGFLFINLFRTSESYALATDGCLTDSYVPVTAEMLAAAKTAGEIPGDTPDQPALTLQQKIEGHWGLAALAAFILFAVAAGLRRKGRTKDRHALIDAGTPVGTLMLDVMCQAAKADGEVDASEIDLIVSISRSLTGTAFDREKVSKIMDLTEKKSNEAEFRALGKGLAPDQRLLLVKGALMVVAADGKLDGKEKDFVARLAKGLDVSPQAVQKLFADLTSAARSATS